MLLCRALGTYHHHRHQKDRHLHAPLARPPATCNRSVRRQPHHRRRRPHSSELLHLLSVPLPNLIHHRRHPHLYHRRKRSNGVAHLRLVRQASLNRRRRHPHLHHRRQRSNGLAHLRLVRQASLNRRRRQPDRHRRQPDWHRRQPDWHLRRPRSSELLHQVSVPLPNLIHHRHQPHLHHQALHRFNCHFLHLGTVCERALFHSHSHCIPPKLSLVQSI